MNKKGQFLPIFKKDLRLVFNIKSLMIIVFVPFIMMFLIISLPTIFLGSATTTVAIYSADVGATVQHVNGTSYFINLGTSSLQNIQLLVEEYESIEIDIVDSRLEALNATNGIYIPKNFTIDTFDNGIAAIEYHKSYSSTSYQGAMFDEILNRIQETVISGFLFLNLEEDIPDYTLVEYIPPSGEPTEGWSQDTIDMASPFAYGLFIMVALIGNMGRTIGFSKEKEDGTFETMLTITKNRTNLVLSKLLVGTIASLLSILAYFAGSYFAGLTSNLLFNGSEEISSSLEGILAIPMNDLLSYKGLILLLGLGLALITTMLALMTIDTLFSRTVSERIGTTLVIGFGMLFYFAVVFDPTTTAFYAQINPFYWLYHSLLSIIDGSFAWVDGLYLGLFAGLFVLMLFLARRAIEREKVLFT